MTNDDTGTCWIDGRETQVKPTSTILPWVKVDTCADGMGCDTSTDRAAQADDDSDGM